MSAKPVEILRAKRRRVERELLRVLEHRAIGVVDRGAAKVALQRLDQRIVQRNVTQKLCVRFQSKETPVRRRDDRGDHLVLPA